MSHPRWCGKYPDYIVLRLETSKEVEAVSVVEGDWLDRTKVPQLESLLREIYDVLLEPLMEFEVGFDGTVAQVWRVVDVA